MNVTLKPLTAVVIKDETTDTASITIKDDRGNIVLGPLVHHALTTKHVWQESINGHIAQLVYKDMNIVNLETTCEGIELP